MLKTKENTILLNNKAIVEKEEELRRLRMAVNHNKAKMDALQRNMRELN